MLLNNRPFVNFCECGGLGVNDREVLSSVSDKTKLLAKNFFKNPNIDDSGISVPVLCSTSNLKVHNF